MLSVLVMSACMQPGCSRAWIREAFPAFQSQLGSLCPQERQVILKWWECWLFSPLTACHIGLCLWLCVYLCAQCQGVGLLLVVCRLHGECSGGCSLLSLVPRPVESAGKSEDQNKGCSANNRTLILVSANHQVQTLDKPNCILSAQSSRKCCKLSSVLFQHTKRDMHTKWRAESKETDFWRPERRRNQGKSPGGFSLQNHHNCCSGQMEPKSGLHLNRWSIL